MFAFFFVVGAVAAAQLADDDPSFSPLGLLGVLSFFYFGMAIPIGFHLIRYAQGASGRS
ncbi:MAG: hypothetical protein JOZ28_07895 [Candidatus Eremiobacteraeota bacterium]|nr:hypothetical protein [Candidatus Eremiobacteraeota bacterium]